MLIQRPYQIMIRYLKNIYFWLSIVSGISFSLLFNQYILLNLWSLESMRLSIASWFSIILFFSVCFWLLEQVLVPQFQRMVKAQQLGVIFVSMFMLPLIVIIGVLNPEKLANEYIRFLVPAHSVEVKVEIPSGDVDKEINIALTGFSTDAQGYISFNRMGVRGWKRVGNKLLLTNPADNQLTWQGKAGERALFIFESRPTAARVMVSWDTLNLKHNLVSDRDNEIRISKKFEIPFYAGWPVLFLSVYLCTAFLSFVLSIALSHFPGLAGSTSTSKGTWLYYALPMYLVWLTYLLVFWPGFMSADSVSQWNQIVTGKFVHAHPVGHTLTMWLITRFWFSPASVAIVQVVALGSVLGWGIATIREFGAPTWLAWLTTIILTFSPANAILSITIWKDILFSTVVVALTILIFKIVGTQGGWLNQKNSWISLGGVLVLVSLYRLNGFFVAVSTLLIVALVYRNYWPSLLKTAGLFLTIYVLFTGIVFRTLDVRVVNMARDEYVIAQLLAGHMQAGTSISIEDQTILRPAFPEYPWPYRCYRNTKLIFTLDRRYLINHSREISDIALQTTLQNPLETLRHFACQGASVYRIPQEYPNEMLWFGIAKNDYGIKTASRLPNLVPVLTNFVDKLIKNRNIVPFAWRMPFWMYLSVFACVMFCMRNKTWRPLLILIPGLVTVLPYIVLTVGQIFRYLYSMYLIGILFSGYLLFSIFPSESPNQEIN